MAQQKAVDPVVDPVDDLVDELQPGAKLLKGQYTITRYINSGGFGITYLAKDSLDRDVVIKECFPSSVCRRSKVMVAARSRAHTAELRSVVQLFVREARNLAKIVHPNIVSVHQVFEDNGTAYMALDFIDGLDLQQVIDGEGTPPTAAETVTITTKLLKAVGFIHDHDMLHRDISPDNILVSKTGEPILIDFGAAREKASQTNRAMSALRVVKDGYSPQEFYIAGSEQGPWSDLYALGATLYHLISGTAPVNGQARLGALAEDRADPYEPLTGRFDGYPKGFLEAIDLAMSTLPKKRLQSATEWLAMYDSGVPAAVTLVEPAPGTDDAVQRLVSDFQREDARIGAATAPAAAAPAKAASKPATPVASASQGKSMVPLLAGVAAALIAVAGGYVMFGGKDPVPESTSAETTAAKADPAKPETATAAAATDGSAATTGLATDGSAAATDPAKPATATATAETSGASEPPPKSAAAVKAEAATTPEATAAAPTAEPAAATAAATDAKPASEPATETAAPAASDTASAAETAPAETAPAEPAPAATEAAAAAETAAAEPALAAPKGSPAGNQVGFAVWDAQLPFTADDRIVGGKSAVVVLRLSPTADLKEAGTWLNPGLTILSVNGIDTPTVKALTATILNAMRVDPDGKARVVVEYTGSDKSAKSGLLTVAAVRLVNLANGVSIRTEVVDGAWVSVVTGVVKPEVTTLRQGDVLFRDKTTGIPLDGPQSLEAILTGLVEAKTTETEFSIVRDSKVSSAVMQLVQADTP